MLAGLPVACRPSEAEALDIPLQVAHQSTAWFVENAAERGLDFVHVAARERRFRFPEIMGSGAAAGDFDAEGDLDLYVVQSGDLDHGPDPSWANRMYANRGQGVFDEVGAAWGVADTGYGMGVTCADIDDDGDLDLYVTNVGPNRLFVNQDDGTFVETAAAAGVADPGWGTSAVFFDADGDGVLDLYVANYVVWSLETDLICHGAADRRDYCHPNEYGAPGADVLYRGRGDGTFEDVSTAAGIDALRANGLGVVAEDFDGDGDIDLYVANDMQANALWINDGEGRFSERGLLAGCAFNGDGEVEASMGVVVFDADGDGDGDLFMTHLGGQRNTFYENRGGGIFADKSAFTGLAGPSIPYTGFGVGVADFDHDGHEDVFVANGRVTSPRSPQPDRAPYAEPDQLFRGLGGGRFEEVFPRGGTESELLGTGRGTVLGDFDGDGDIDVVVVQNGGPLLFLENVAPKRGHWAQFDVAWPPAPPADRTEDGRGASPGRLALGARVRVTAGGRSWSRVVRPAQGYASYNAATLHVGLGSAERIDQVEVLYGDGSTATFGPLPVDRLNALLRP